MIWPVAEALRSRLVPFLFLSAYAEEKCIPAIFADVICLSKPLQPRHLVDNLQAIWEESAKSSRHS